MRVGGCDKVWCERRGGCERRDSRREWSGVEWWGRESIKGDR